MAGYYDRDNDDAQPSMKWPKPHHGSVPEYAVSGWPCMKSGTATGTDAPNTITFEYVTRWIQITNTSAVELYLSFADPADASPAGTPKTYYTVLAGDVSPRLELKCVKLYINTSSSSTPATYSILAGLTAIPAAGFPDISGLTGVSH
jgi:hypothetical protein